MYFLNFYYFNVDFNVAWQHCFESMRKKYICDKKYVISLLRAQVYDKCYYYSLKWYWESVWYGYVSSVSTLAILLSVIKLLN